MKCLLALVTMLVLAASATTLAEYRQVELTIYESGGVLKHVYFPVNSIVSLLYVMESGASAEISVIGNEGMVGVSVFMGGESTPSRAIVQERRVGLSTVEPANQGGV